MNKLLQKVAKLFLGISMAAGVGVAVGSKEAKSAEAVNYAWQKITSTSEFADGTEILVTQGSYYLNVSATSTSQTPRLASLTLSSGLPTLTANNTECFLVSGSGSSIKLCKATDTTKWLLTGSSNNAARINTGTTGQYWTISSAGTNEFYLQSNSGSRYLSRYSTTDFRSYTNSGTNANLVLYKLVESQQTQTITVDPASMEAYTDETISLTTNATSASWALSNNTCGASLSAASGKTVSVSATSAGSVRVTATASGYTSPYVDLTFSEKPTSPFITPEKASASGYTGQNESISFTYGNLTGSLGVTSSDTAIVTVGSPSYNAGEGSVQFNYVGAGSTTVKFQDGSTDLASVNVNVTASSVSITGMPATKSIGNGATLNLGALITVTPTGSYSSDVTWSTGNSSIAGVTQAGVVTGAGVGFTTITVTPDDYPAGAVSCAVTVANIITATFATGTTDGTGKTTDEQIKAVEGYVIDSNIEFTSIANCYGSTGNALKFGSSSAKGSITVGLIDGKVNSKSAYITKIVVNTIAYGTDSTTLQIAGNDHTLTTSWADYEEEFEGTSTTTVLIEAKNASKNRFRISSIDVYYDYASELDSVTSSGQTTLFTHGGTFAYGGTLTAHYTGGKADATVTPTEYKYGASGFDPASAGTAITIGTTLSIDTHNGKYVSVGYTEDGITKWSALYQITVTYAAVTSVSLSQNSAEIGLNETFDYTQVTVTVSPSNANPAVTWSVSANTVDDDYVFDGSGLLSGDTEGTITLKCESDADSSKYATIVVSVTGDPTAAFDKESTSGYAGKTEIIGFTYGNMDDVNKIVVASSNTSYVTVANDLLADEGVGLVTINFVAEGSANVTISYDGGSILDTLTVSVSADTVVSVSWSASNFDVFSGTTLTSDIDNTWLASYEKASGDEGLLEYGDYTLKLGGSAITLPHTWAAADNGKTLCIEYGGVSSSTVSVTVTQTINAVYAPNTSTDTVSWTASQAADLGSQISSEGGTDTGTISTGTYSWNYTRTLTSLASGKSDNISFQGSTWIQLGSNNSMESIVFTTSEIPGTIKSVSVVVATAGSHELTIDVGGTKYLEGEGLTLYTGTVAAANPDPTDCVETGTGSSSGAITITIAPTASTKKAMVIRSISVTYETEGSGTTNIANNASHKAAQRAAVKFAQAFNLAVANGNTCSTEPVDGGSSAWTNCQTAYNTFLSEASGDLTYAKNLLKYAEREYSDNSDEACIERMMKTYEILVGRGYTAFMSEFVTVNAPRVSPVINIIGENTNTVAIIVIISMVSVTAIGGYFFLRKRRENI